MSIALSPEAERLLREEVLAGGYASADELVRDAVRLLAARRRAAAPPDSTDPASIIGDMAEYAEELDAAVEAAYRDRERCCARPDDAG